MSVRPPQSIALSDPLFTRLKNHVIEATGLSYYQDKDRDLAERIERRLSSLAIADCNEYFQLLQGPGGSRELEALISELTIGETYFFRHSEQFDALRDSVLPEIIAKNQLRRTLKIWSAGCATGAEPYSIAILLAAHFSQRLAGWDVNILATDINKKYLAQAQRGNFDEWAFRGFPTELRSRYFKPSGKSWAIEPEYKKNVTFQYHNLITNTFPLPPPESCEFDLIVCRNVIIYFSQIDCAKIVSQFERCLVDGGWLMVGHSEPNTEMFNSFRTVLKPGAVLYQRRAANETLPAPPVYSFSMPNLTAPFVDGLPALDFAAEKGPEPVDRRLDRHTPVYATPLVPLLAPRPEPPVLTEPPVLAERITDVPTLDAVRRLADNGEWQEAAACAEALLRHDGLDSRVQFYYALILEHTGRDAESEQALRRAVYLDRNSVLAHYYLGLRLQRNRAGRDAARSFENVLKLLNGVRGDHVFPDADGITAGELSHLTHVQMELLNEHARHD